MKATRYVVTNKLSDFEKIGMVVTKGMGIVSGLRKIKCIFRFSFH